VADGVLSTETADRLLGAARRLFFKERTLPAILAAGWSAGLKWCGADALAAWLPANRVDLKRRDALALLDAVRDLASRSPPPLRVPWPFVWTDAWDRVFREIEAEGPDDAEAAVLDELRLEPRSFRSFRQRALERVLALRGAHGLGTASVDSRSTAVELRASLGLSRRQQLEAWLAANRLPPNGVERLAAEQARIEAVAAGLGARSTAPRSTSCASPAVMPASPHEPRTRPASSPPRSTTRRLSRRCSTGISASGSARRCRMTSTRWHGISA
jgi:hypothetical protein